MALSSRGKLLVVLAAPLVVFGGLELGLRVFGFENQVTAIPVLVWNRAQDTEMRSTEALHRTDPHTLWSPRPGAPLPDSEGERINAAGYRGPLLSAEKPAGVLRVALLGESAMFGMGLPYAQTVGPQLEALAAERGLRVEVLNAGVIGFTAWQGAERYRQLVRGHDVDVVFAGFGTVNEHFPCKGLPDERKLQELRTGTSAAGQLAVWLRTNSRVLHLTSWLGLRARGEDVQQTRRRFRDENLRNAHADDYGEFDWDGARRVSLESFGRALWDLRDAVQADGARFVMVAMPRGPGMLAARPVVQRYTEALRVLQGTLDVPLLDLAATFAADLAAGGDFRAWFVPQDELHLSAVGNERLAQAMLAYLED